MLKATSASRVSRKQASAGITTLVVRKWQFGVFFFQPAGAGWFLRAGGPALTGFNHKAAASLGPRSLADHTSSCPGPPGTVRLCLGEIPAEISESTS